MTGRRLAALGERLLAGEAVVAGVMSGTSGDGVDVALLRPRFAETDGDLELAALEPLAFETVPFDDAVPGLGGEVRAWLDAAVRAGPVRPLADVARFDAELGRGFGLIVRFVAERAGVRVDLVGSHGQTVWHHDGRKPHATLQLGDGCHLAEAAGATVVSDFRRADIAAGGHGAPIAAHVEAWLLGAEAKWVLNLGGIGNLALLRDGEVVLSFDTGPAGVLLDGLAKSVLGAARDLDGAAAARGREAGGEGVARALSELMGLEVGGVSLGSFAAEELPKSTGRDSFGAPFVQAVVAHARERGWADELLMAAATEAVALSVVESVRQHGRGADAAGLPFFSAGGGVHNRALMAALERGLLGRPDAGAGEAAAGREPAAGAALAASFQTTAALGIDPDGREAFAFGLLACANVLGQPLPLSAAPGAGPFATGAHRRVVLGKLSIGP